MYPTFPVIQIVLHVLSNLTEIQILIIVYYAVPKIVVIALMENVFSVNKDIFMTKQQSYVKLALATAKPV